MGFLSRLGPIEIIIILAIILLLFGGTIVKTVAKRAGETTKEIKKAKKEFEDASKEVESARQQSAAFDPAARPAVVTFEARLSF